MEDYEGRIYPEPRDGYLERIHQLPKDWLVDPNWGKTMINPSRIAIMLSD
jgi:starch synthase